MYRAAHAAWAASACSISIAPTSSSPAGARRCAVPSATSSIISRPCRSERGARFSARIRDPAKLRRRDILPQRLMLAFDLGEPPFDDVADRDHPNQPIVGDDGKMAKPP